MENFQKLSEDEMKTIVGGLNTGSIATTDTCSGETLCGSNCITRGKAYTKCSIKP